MLNINKYINNPNSLIKSISCFEIDDKIINELLEKAILSVSSLNITAADKKIIINKRFNKLLNIYIKDLFKDHDRALNILTNYINKLHMTNKRELALPKLQKITLFCYKYNYLPSTDDWLNLITTNKVLNNILISIVSLYQKQINKSPLKSIFDDDIVCLVIEEYCMLNNITVNNNLISNNVIPKFNNKIETNNHNEIKLSIEEQNTLLEKIKLGDKKAYELFAKYNLKLVYFVAKQFVDKGVAFEDLVGEGNVALLKAINDFDYQKGFTFSTYAVPCIKNHLIRVIYEKGKLIRKPVHLYEKYNKIKKATLELKEELKREPTKEEIAKKANINIDYFQTILDSQNNIASLEDIKERDYKESSLENMIVENNKYQILYDILYSSNLTNQELNVLKYRFGLGDNDILNISEIAELFNVTKQRVDTIEGVAIRKIRSNKEVDELISYMDNPREAKERLELYRKLYEDKANKSKKFYRYDIDDLKLLLNKK